MALIHAPSVYDFRKRGYVHYGPISDVIPSKPIFDMYPAGFFSLVSYLEERGVKTGIFNIAAKMVNDPDVDVARLIRQIDAKVYGIDLHWLFIKSCEEVQRASSSTPGMVAESPRMGIPSFRQYAKSSSTTQRFFI